MQSKGLMTSAFALAVLFLMVMAVPSWGASIPCTGQLGAVEIKGNLHAGPGCDLLGTTVSGNVIVEPGGGLETNFACRTGRSPRCQEEPTTTLITGNVQSSEAAEVILAGATSVEGNLQLRGTGAGAGATNLGSRPVQVYGGGAVKGDVEIKGGVPGVVIEGETVGGNVQILNNSSPSNVSFQLHLVEDAVGGNVEVGNNSSFAFLEELELRIVLNSVEGNLRLYNNSVQGFENINGNTVAGNQVGGNAELLDNTISGEFGTSLFVRRNAVTNTLNCLGNEPPPEGSLNTAKHKLGQCELL